jgi:hypothetical protein
MFYRPLRPPLTCSSGKLIGYKVVRGLYRGDPDALPVFRGLWYTGVTIFYRPITLLFGGPSLLVIGGVALRGRLMGAIGTLPVVWYTLLLIGIQYSGSDNCAEFGVESRGPLAPGL